MNANKTLSFLLLATGEIIIISSFLIFGKNLNANLMILNITVSSIIYSLFFWDILFPIVVFKDKSQKTIGSIGLRWYFTFLYMFFAIGVMVFFGVFFPVVFKFQLMIQIILLFLFIFGTFISFEAGEKVKDVYDDVHQTSNLFDEIKKQTYESNLKLNKINNPPAIIVERMKNLFDNFRYVSPCNNPKAQELEQNYLLEIKSIDNLLTIVPENYDKILEKINICEKIIKERKQIFSN